MQLNPLGKESIKGGEIVTRLLAAEGVDTVFGIVDGTYFGLYSTFEKHGIRLITPRHETSAVHMAGSFARLTGKLGVCMASNGPGVANALPGVAVEELEGNRVLLVTSSRRHAIVEPDRGGAYQCFPQSQAIDAMSKGSFHVPSIDRVAELTRRALRLCFTGRPGVVHLDVPEDLMNGSFEPDPTWFREPGEYRQLAPLRASEAQVAEAARLLAKADKPVIHAGSGVIHAQAFEALVRVAERLHAPVVTSWAARAVIDERHPLSVSMVYVDTVTRARKEADVVLVLGSRLGETDWWGKPPYWGDPAEQATIQVDIDPEHLGNIRPLALPVQADVGAFLQALERELPSRAGAQDARHDWVDSLKSDMAKRRRKLDKKLSKKGVPMHSARVPVICDEFFDDDAIVVVDGGNTAIWGNFYTQVTAPNTVLSTPKMGMLGAGCSQALAAQIAHPDRQVYCMIGDGAMGFHPQEVETAVREGLPVIWLVFADRQWGMVKMTQQFALKPLKTLVRGSLGPDETIKADLGEIRWDDLARSMGAHGERVADASGLRGALERAVASGKPAVIHVDVDRVAHMWAPNLQTFKDMHAEPGE